MIRRYLIVLFALLTVAHAALVRAEMGEITIGRQYSISFLPFMLMERDKLIEKQAAAAGIDGLKVKWVVLGGGAAVMDGMISGNLTIGGAAPPALITLWAKTKGTYDIRGIIAASSMPGYLNTRNPSVRSIKDFTEKDKIALPAVKVSLQALILQMAAAQAYGQQEYRKLDALTVTMANPDALIALSAGGTDVTSHFTAPPFSHWERQIPGVRTILNSNDVLGGPASITIAFCTAKFRQENPKTYGVFVAALRESIASINKDHRNAAQAYLQIANDRTRSVQDIVDLLKDPDLVFTDVPQNVSKYADFMKKVGTISESAASWKDLFFPEAHNLPGS